MFIKDYHKITSRLHKGIKFYHFHVSHGGLVDVYNERCEFYGAFMDVNSFYKMYKQSGEELNLTRNQEEQN